MLCLKNGLIAISGKLGAGKNTAANMLQSELLAVGFDYDIVAFADPMKDEYCATHGLTRAQLELIKDEHRKGLQDLGHGRRQEIPKYWIKKLAESLHTGQNVIIADQRYLNEFEWVKNNRGLNFRVIASEKSRGERRALIHSNHPSETELDNIPTHAFDSLLVNDGSMTTLHIQVKKAVQRLLPIIQEISNK